MKKQPPIAAVGLQSVDPGAQLEPREHIHSDLRDRTRQGTHTGSSVLYSALTSLRLLWESLTVRNLQSLLKQRGYR